MKSIALILTLAAGLMVTIATMAEANGEVETPPAAGFGSMETNGPVTLREMVSITGDVIYLSDLFTNVTPELAARVIAYAPEPGRRAMYGADWLYRVARHYKLDWTPRTVRTQSIITRESIVIDRNQIEETIMLNLVEQGVDPEMSVELSNRNIRLFLPVTAIPDIAVSDLRYDERTRRFSANITAPANSPDAQHFRLNGRVFRMTDTPVLVRQVSSREIISEGDIEWLRVRSDRISKETILDPADLIGMSPKRGIRPGSPIRLSEVAAPTVVKKKSLVTIIFQHPFMTLTAKGRALQNGAVGDVIRITNIQSKMIVDAEIIGSGKAVVKSNELLAMNQNN